MTVYVSLSVPLRWGLGSYRTSPPTTLAPPMHWAAAQTTAVTCLLSFSGSGSLLAAAMVVTVSSSMEAKSSTGTGGRLLGVMLNVTVACAEAPARSVTRYTSRCVRPAAASGV